jgi:hypothetical protein
MQPIDTASLAQLVAVSTRGEGEWTVFPLFDGEDRLDVRICLVPNRKPVLQVRPGYSHPSTLQG